MEDLIEHLKSNNDQDFYEALETFVENYSHVTAFGILDEKNCRSQVWGNIFLYLENEKDVYKQQKCLAALKILSRDKTNLNSILTKEKVNIVLKYADLDIKKNEYMKNSVMNEGQKLLCNIIFNSTTVQSMIVETPCLENVVNRITTYISEEQHEFKLFDVRIIFLITALNVSSRNIVKNEFHGDIHLINLLDNILKLYSDDNCKIKDDDVMLICEILKALFNLFIQQSDPTLDEIEAYELMTFLLRRLLLHCNKNDIENLESHVVNLLTVLPSNCYLKLIEPVSENQKVNHVYQDMDVTAIEILITFLNSRLDCTSNLIENLSPIFTCLIRMCRSEKLIRKYVRLQVLPPLKDVMKRPEEGSTLRNKLCKLLTTPITEIRDLDAEFLFILCKEKVGRMIKYTGYGNAAGMFANKGLLGPQHAKVDYSSESEDSETEEYEQYKDSINPVIGCYEGSKPNPLEAMSEEQKEYEAMKLIDLVDQLQKKGVIQPCFVGDDGKPKVMEHVLELKEQLSKQQIKRRDPDFDGNEG